MSWSVIRWTWLLEAPLFVGAPPAGALNRCRPYVLSRGIWGALTSESAQAGANGFPDYRQRGRTLREDARYTYLYPAARVNGSWLAWLPAYMPGQGRVWRQEDEPATAKMGVPDRRFRGWLIDTRPGTAIDPDSDSAAEATLRETECVLTHWRSGSPAAGDRVAFVGYGFLRDGSATNLDQVTTLFLGGDTRYGLGRMKRVTFDKADAVFGATPVLDGNAPVVVSSHLLGHGTCSQPIRGAKEALAGWDRTTTDPLMSLGASCWAPGSRTDQDVRWRLEEEGTWTEVA